MSFESRLQAALFILPQSLSCGNYGTKPTFAIAEIAANFATEEEVLWMHRSLVVRFSALFYSGRASDALAAQKCTATEGSPVDENEECEEFCESSASHSLKSAVKTML